MTIDFVNYTEDYDKGMLDQSAQPKTLTMQMRLGASHLMVTVPSTSLSQKQEPEMLSPQSAFCMMMQFAINLKFLLVPVIYLRILVRQKLHHRRSDWSRFEHHWRYSFYCWGVGWWRYWLFVGRRIGCYWRLFIFTLPYFKYLLRIDSTQVIDKTDQLFIVMIINKNHPHFMLLSWSYFTWSCYFIR